MKIIPGVRHTEEEMYSMDEDELIRLANEQLAQANPEPVDSNPSGRNTENQGLAGHFDGTIFPDRMHRSLLGEEPPLREIDPSSNFWTSSAIPPKKR
jgi:hypothetical protein